MRFFFKLVFTHITRDNGFDDDAPYNFILYVDLNACERMEFRVLMECC